MRQITLLLVGDCRIQVGGADLTPSATHLFALALFLTLERSRWVGRQELQDILFDPSVRPSLASHRLRQLLYRLRAKGMHFDERQSALRIHVSQIAHHLGSIQHLTPIERSDISTSALRILPSYAPTHSQAFSEWLEGSRAAIERDLATILLNDLTQLRATHSWGALSKLSATLRKLDPLNVDVVVARAESLAMTGQRDGALHELDTFQKDALGALPESEGLTLLKTRLLKTRLPPPRDTPLVGRSDCLALLEDQWMRVADNGARLVTLVGSAGIGKTRVADAFATSTSLGVANVLQYRCGSDGRHYPLSLFSYLLPELRGLRGSLGISPEHHTLLTRLRLPLRSSRAVVPRGISKEALRADIVAALIDLLEATSSERRLLLIIDDAHLLDNASAAVLRQLSSSSNRASLLAIACCRPGDGAAPLLEPSERTCSFVIKALSDAEARTLLSLMGSDHMSDTHAEWCVSQAEGNPFYLRALAGHNVHSRSGSGISFDITTLAEGSYLSLSATERLVLECCLFLGQHGTLARIALTTSLGDIALSAALRRLEELDLVRLIGVSVRGPHALLVDALRGLIPTTVSALVHKRVADVLAQECEGVDHPPSLALAAAQNYLAAGDISAAQVLIRRCAHEAALVGEPGAAAELLAQLLSTATMPTQSRTTLLDSIIKYAAESGAREIAARALEERLAIARAIGEKPGAVLRFELELLEARLLDGSTFSSAIAPLSAVVKHPDADRGVRLQGLVDLLIIADAEYDRTLADSLLATMSVEELTSDLSSPDAMRALLIYHTTFGQLDIAESIAVRLLHCFNTPSLDEACRTARRFASYSLYRMVKNSEARSALECDYAYMASHAIRSEALYASSLLTEIAINEGNFVGAREWFTEMEIQLRGASAHKLAPNSGYYSSAAILAMMRGKYQEADKFISAPQVVDARMHTARYESLCLALAVRLHMMRGSIELCREPVERLKELFKRGCALGGQDSIVEQLWCSEIMNEGEYFASETLSTYLHTHRRENGPCEWFFRHTTGADLAWVRHANI